MIAFVVPVGAREVTRAKKLISVLMRGQGRVPFRPIPRRVRGSGFDGSSGATRIGVVATMRVRGDDVGGILVFRFMLED